MAPVRMGLTAQIASGQFQLVGRVKLAFDLLQHFRRSRAKRIGQFENDLQCRLIDPSLNETDEISFDPRRQSELLLCQPSIFPELTKHASE